VKRKKRVDPKLTGEEVVDGLSRQEYMAMHGRCAVCHWPANRPGRWMELHHIVGGPGRKDLPGGENWISLCNRCHRCVHDCVSGHPPLPKGAILTAKAHEDGEVDVAALAALRRQKALLYEPEPIPEFYESERHRRGGDPWP